MNVTEKNLLIKTDTGEYPLTTKLVQSRVTTHSFGEIVEYGVLKELGYAVVEPVAKPVVDGVEFREDKPVLVNGAYKQTYVQVTKTEEDLLNELKSSKFETLSRITASLETALGVGAPYNFGTAEEPVINHIQLRAGDRTNLLILLEASKLLPNEHQPLRTFEDVIFTLPGESIMDVVVSSLSYYSALMRKYWEVKDVVKTAQSKDDLPIVPEILVP